MTDTNMIASLEQTSGERSLSLIFSSMALAVAPIIALAAAGRSVMLFSISPPFVLPASNLLMADNETIVEKEKTWEPR
jgi:hypothetical protein